MAKPIGAQELPKLDELFRLPGAPAAAAVSKAGKATGKAALRKRLDEEIIAPEAAFTAGENLPDQPVATDEIPPQSLEEEVAGEEELAEEGTSAEDAYSSVEADAWSADWTPATGSEDNILLAQAGSGTGGAGGDDDGAGGLNVGVFAGIGALLLLGGGGGGGGGDAGAANFAEINGQLGALPPDVTVAATSGIAHNFFIGSAAGLGVNEGFDRDDLPTTAQQLDSKVVYDFRFSKYTAGTGTIAPSGLQVNMAAGDTTDINIYVSASADATTESHLVWLGNAGISGPTASADAFIRAQAIASSGGDAEVGISNVNISLAGAGTLTASASLQAAASGTDSMAGAFVGNDMVVNVAGTVANATVAYVRAYAYGSDAVASAGIGGNLSVDAIGVNVASASAGSIYASALSGAAAGVLIGGNVDVYAAADSSGDAYAYVDEIFADASVDSLAQVDILGPGGVSARAFGNDHVSAHIGEIRAEADGLSSSYTAIPGYGSTAEVHIGGDVYAFADAPTGSAYASVESITADASTSSYANVDIDGGVSVRALGQDLASAYVGQISADADGAATYSGDAIQGGGSSAKVLIAEGVDVYADAATGVAYAELESISASASASSYAKVDIGGSVSVRAFGSGWASAYIGDIGASAEGAMYDGEVVAEGGSTAEVDINGAINVYAHAATGTALAYMDSISAYASTSSLARVDIGSGSGGGVSVQAFGQVGAVAGMEQIHAEAEGAQTYYGASIVGAGSTAEIDIAGGIDVFAGASYAGASYGTAQAYMESITAAASTGSNARVDIGGNVSVQAFGQALAYAQMDDIAASAYGAESSYGGSVGGAGSTAEVVIAGGIDVYARASYGTAYAAMGSINAVVSTSSYAKVDVGGSVSARAFAQDFAYAHMGTISASAEGAETYTGDTIVGAGSTAEVDIAGGLNLYAGASSGAAYAWMESISASASTSSSARVDIGGSVLVKAFGQDFAYADMGDIAADAEGASTNSGDTLVYAGSTAEVNIVGRVDVYAHAASGAAYANISSIYAYASRSSLAEVDIGGGVSVGAVGQGKASVQMEIITADAGEDSQAKVSIGGEVSVRASASSQSYATSSSTDLTNYAVAHVSVIGAYAELTNAYARVLIDQGVNVRANATYVSATAQASSTTSAFATANASNGALAYVENITAYAGDTNAQATLSIGGSLRVSATASAYASADASSAVFARAYASATNFADAHVGAIGASAADNSGEATVLIGGDLSVRASASYATALAHASSAAFAWAYATASNAAEAYVGDIRAYADDTNAQALVQIGEDVVVRANANAVAYASASNASYATATANADADAQAWLGGLLAYASAPFADATVSIDGSVLVGAIASAYAQASAAGASYASAYASASSDARAYVGGIRANATYTDANASVLIGGDVVVYARASASASASANGFVSDSDSDATYASANAFVGTISASATGGGSILDAVANVTIGGGLNVYATANDGNAYAYVSDIVAFASDYGQASITIGPASATSEFDAVRVHAEGENFASAYVPIHAYAAASEDAANIVINGNVRVSASADSGDAYAALFVGAGVTYRSTATHTGEGRVEINGDVHLRATAAGSAYSAYAFGQVIAEGSGSVYVAGSVNIAVSEDGYTWLDIFGAGSNAVDIGNLNVYVGTSASADVYIQRSVSTTPIDEFLTHGSSNANVSIGDLSVNVAANAQANFYMGGGTQGATGTFTDGIDWDQARVADLNGAGDVDMQLFDQIYGRIDLTEHSGALSLEYDLGDHDFATIGSGANQAHVTKIVGFDPADVNIQFNADPATPSNFVNLGSVATTTLGAALTAALNVALLDGGTEDQYAFAVYQGIGDLDGDGNPDTGAGVLAYDRDGLGITAVLMLPGVTTMVPSDIDFPP